MSKKRLKKLGQFLAEHKTFLEFPISYVLYEQQGEFKVNVYHKGYPGGDTSGPHTGDVPFAIWNPDDGLVCFNSTPWVVLRDAGLLDEVQEFCEKSYSSWKDL